MSVRFAACGGEENAGWQKELQAVLRQRGSAPVHFGLFRALSKIMSHCEWSGVRG